MQQDQGQSKLPVRQLTQQGISSDYYNSFLAVVIQYRDLDLGIEGAVDCIRQHPIPRYTDEFPPDKFHSVVTPFNQAAVVRLDTIAELLNAKARAGVLSDQDYRALHLEASKLIYGPDRKEHF